MDNEERKRIMKNNRNKRYRDNHLDIIHEKKSVKIQCECSKFYTHCHKTRHEKTKFHEKYLNSINL